ncbi:metal-sensitive transcriptional regulator [Brachybacterium sp. EF45031]|uniref:metal-sensitive transcriptional regulator n=1 Tax=Brachybacterium sillae TaxID=2810536 RepID=UPI00217D1151|nr:metal-sensitive transcriptional regulator [Brachybacterium sillae]MCS6711756.1 metal-sensitive transcriptional regulator [Brachybacterium sillae]
MELDLDPEELRAVRNRLSRANGQLTAIIRMLDEGSECQDVVTQLAAVSKALDRAGFALISTQLQHCIAAGTEPDRKQLEKLFLSLA